MEHRKAFHAIQSVPGLRSVKDGSTSTDTVTVVVAEIGECLVTCEANPLQKRVCNDLNQNREQITSSGTR